MKTEGLIILSVTTIIVMIFFFSAWKDYHLNIIREQFLKENKALCLPDFFVKRDSPANGLEEIVCMDKNGKKRSIFKEEAK